MRKASRASARILAITSGVVVVLIAAILILPYAFRGRIMEAVKHEVNKNLDARLDFEDLGVGIIYNFPDLSLRIKGLCITGINEFDGDTLAYIPGMKAVVDIMSVIRGDVYEVKRISIDEPLIRLKKISSGKANWDIVPSDGEEYREEPASEETASSFTVALRHFRINNAGIFYEDEMSNTRLALQSFDHYLSGDLTAERTLMQALTTIGSVTFIQDGIAYLNNAIVDFNASIDADLQNEIYSFEKNRLKINELILQFDGSVAMVEGDPEINLAFEAPQNTFRNFLSLVPAIYSREFNDIETSGTLALNGFVKGKYTANSLPSFDLNVEVDNAEFRYPELPASVNDINLDLKLSNPGGSEDNTVIDIRKMHFSVIGSPFDLKAVIKNPVSDPYIDARLVTSLNLADISKVYPMEENESLRGMLDANITMKLRLSAIENQHYEKCEINGSLSMKEMRYAMEGYDKEFLLNNAQMNFAPAYIDLLKLDFNYGESDMTLKGRIENYILYLVGDGILKGRFTASSNFFNVDQFISTGEEEARSPEMQDEEELTAFMVPSNLDMEIAAVFRKLIYDSIPISNVLGQVLVREEKLIMRRLEGELFGGNINIDGSYSTHKSETPIVDITLNVDRISFKEAFGAFGIMERYVPMVEHALGDFSTGLSFSTMLDMEMMPVWETFNGKGLLNSTAVRLENVNTLNMLSDALKTDLFRSLSIGPVKIAFDFQEGKLIVKPIVMEVEGMNASLSGWTSIDKRIGYDFNIKLPRNILGGEANKIIDGLISQVNAAGANFKAGETIPLDVAISGTLANPVVSPGIGNSGSDILKDINKELKEELDKKKEELEKQAKEKARKILDDAEKQAQEILAEAQKRADQVRSLAREGAQKIKKDTDAHAQKLIAEGKKKGPLAEMAAKKAADEYKIKAYSEADKGVAEADKKADNIMNEARQKADNIRVEALKKAGNI